MDRSWSDAADSPYDGSVSLARLFHTCGIVDVWRSLHPSDSSFTWVRHNGSFTSQLDLIGLPVPQLLLVNFCEISPCLYSDHCVILSAPVSQALSRGPGIWNLNTSWFWSRTSTWLSELFLGLTVVDWWEAAKTEIKGLTVTSCKNRVSRLRSQRDLFVRLISYLKSQVDNGRESCVGPCRTQEIGSWEAEEARVRARLGRLRRVSAPRLTSSGWRKRIAVSAFSLLYGNLMGLCLLILKASRLFWHIFNISVFAKEETDKVAQAYSLF